MKIMVTSWRGHHEAVVMEPEVSEAIFEKMTGQTVKPLPVEYKTKIPDSFQELEGLWTKGKMGYTAMQGQNGEMEVVKEFDPKIEDLLFIAPIIGG